MEAQQLWKPHPTLPTDDRHFSFNIIRLGNLMERGLHASGVYRISHDAVYVLLALLAITLLLSAALVMLPLWIASWRKRIASVRRPSANAELPYLGYFAATQKWGAPMRIALSVFPLDIRWLSARPHFCQAS